MFLRYVETNDRKLVGWHHDAIRGGDVSTTHRAEQDLIPGLLGS
jgi:hypothetical protein